MTIDICTTQNAVVVTYSIKGSGKFRIAVFSQLINDVANQCHIIQVLNTIHHIADFYDVKFKLIVKDRGTDIKKGFEDFLIQNPDFCMESLDCLGGLLLDVYSYLQSGRPITKNNISYSAKVSAPLTAHTLSDVTFFESLSLKFKKTLEAMKEKADDEEPDLDQLFSYFCSFHKKLMVDKLIDQSERDFLNKMVSHMDGWETVGEKEVLELLRREIIKVIRLSMDALNYLEITVYETEKRNDNHGAKLSLRKKYEMLRRYPGQFHSISKCRYNLNKHTIKSLHNFRKFVQCEVCGTIIPGKSSFRTHFISHHLTDDIGMHVKFHIFNHKFVSNNFLFIILQECTACKKLFANYGVLSYHRSKTHPKMYCNGRCLSKRENNGVCRLFFYSEEDLEIHFAKEKEKQAEMKLSRTCKKCDKLFSRFRSLREHNLPGKICGPPQWIGLANLGNTCYMNCVMQVVFSIPDFIQKFVDRAEEIFWADPTNDFNLQM